MPIRILSSVAAGIVAVAVTIPVQESMGFSSNALAGFVGFVAIYGTWHLTKPQRES